MLGRRAMVGGAATASDTPYRVGSGGLVCSWIRAMVEFGLKLVGSGLPIVLGQPRAVVVGALELAAVALPQESCFS